jgi:hypothetical protein
MASSGTRQSGVFPSKRRINSTFFSPRPRQVLMAFSGFGKLKAASAPFTQPPAGLRNLFRETCRTMSLLGSTFFVCMAIELHFFWSLPIGSNPTQPLRRKVKRRVGVEFRRCGTSIGTQRGWQDYSPVLTQRVLAPFQECVNCDYPLLKVRESA